MLPTWLAALTCEMLAAPNHLRNRILHALIHAQASSASGFGLHLPDGFEHCKHIADLNGADGSIALDLSGLRKTNFAPGIDQFSEITRKPTFAGLSGLPRTISLAETESVEVPGVLRSRRLNAPFLQPSNATRAN